MTNASAPAPYADVSDALSRYDARLWGQLCGDVGVQYTAAQLADRSTLPGQRLAALLADASFDVESACTRGKRYTADDLAGLQGNARAGLVRLVVDRAILLAHRGRQPLSSSSDLYKETAERLKRLEMGEDIFATEEAEGAGSGQEQVALPDEVAGPKPALSQVSERFFGRRARSLPSYQNPVGR